VRCTLRAPATLRGDVGQGRRGWHIPERRGGGEAEEGLGTTAFADGEGAPMVDDGGCGVLQHRCGRGKRELTPIWEWRSSEGAHRRGGRQRPWSAKSDARERPPVARGSAPGAKMVGREVALERGAVVGSVTREGTSGRSAVCLSELGRWRG
jgi:hypothetical protein